VKNALQQNPNLGEARFLLGSALLDSGDLSGAEVELRKALELKHPADAVVPLLAVTMLGLGQAKKLVDEFGRRRSLRVDRRPPSNDLGTAYAGWAKLRR
jgi:Flp pilus assembly protein TadD